MPYVPFEERFSEIAREETRSITLFPNNQYNLPAGNYGFIEMFCDECSCKRVFFCVVKEGVDKPLAVVYWGWGSTNFYKKNFFLDSKKQAKLELIGPDLNPSSPQSDYARGIVKLISEVLLKDNAYVERVKHHYRMFNGQH